jgi:hypothetical protein
MHAALNNWVLNTEKFCDSGLHCVASTALPDRRPQARRARPDGDEIVGRIARRLFFCSAFIG